MGEQAEQVRCGGHGKGEAGAYAGQPLCWLWSCCPVLAVGQTQGSQRAGFGSAAASP